MDRPFIVLFLCARCTRVESQRHNSGGKGFARFVGLATGDILHECVAVCIVRVPSAQGFTKVFQEFESTVQIGTVLTLPFPVSPA